MMRALAMLESVASLTLADIKCPAIGHNDVLIHIRKTAICGTNVHIWE